MPEFVVPMRQHFRAALVWFGFVFVAWTGVDRPLNQVAVLVCCAAGWANVVAYATLWAARRAHVRQLAEWYDALRDKYGTAATDALPDRFRERIKGRE